MSHPAPPTISIDALGSSPDFRALGTLPQVRVDLRYASTRNLLGHDLYSPHDCAWLHAEAAASLKVAPGSPALRITRVNRDQHGRIIDCDLEFWRHDAIHVSVEVPE